MSIHAAVRRCDRCIDKHTLVLCPPAFLSGFRLYPILSVLLPAFLANLLQSAHLLCQIILFLPMSFLFSFPGHLCLHRALVLFFGVYFCTGYALWWTVLLWQKGRLIFSISSFSSCIFFPLALCLFGGNGSQSEWHRFFLWLPVFFTEGRLPALQSALPYGEAEGIIINGDLLFRIWNCSLYVCNIRVSLC